jgi:hypothetical protein
VGGSLPESREQFGFADPAEPRDLPAPTFEFVLENSRQFDILQSDPG